jgi:ubiquinone/menaquinone biosynthesis C-methylase UbiE
MMRAELQRRVQRYGWDRSADAYERLWQHALAPAHDRLLEMAGIRSGERVLDVACGSGLVSFRAAALAGPTGWVTATDISEQMVGRVRAAAVERGAVNICALRMDAEDLRLPDDDVDVALCALGLMYFPQPERALAQVCRVLRPGGRVVVAVWGRRERCGWHEVFPIVDARVRSDVCPLFFRLGADGALARELERAGFSAVTCERVTTTINHQSGDEACDAAFVGGPVALAYARFDDAVRAEVRAQYLATVEQYRRGEEYSIPAEFMIAGGRKG